MSKHTETDLLQTIDERDRYHDTCDKLAEAIAEITGFDIGEHSSANCPWQCALDAAADYVGIRSRAIALREQTT